MKYIISLVLIFTCTGVYAQAVAQIRSHNQLTGTGTNSHTTIDNFISSKAQASGVASLDASGNVVQSAGTVTLSGGYVKQTNGTATSTQLTSVQINSGTGTLSAATIAGVSAPYIAQTSGTGSGNTLNNSKLTGNTAIGTTSTATDVVDIDLGSGNMLIQSNSGYPQTQEIRGGAAADGNLLATRIYQGKDSAGNSTNYAGIYSVSSNVTNGSETGILDFYLSDNGSYALRGRWKGANLGIGTSTPANKLTVAGTIESTTGGVKYPDGNTQTEAIIQLVKGITAGSGILIDQSTGTVTITSTGTSSAGGWTDGTNTVYPNVAADKVIIGSTTASGSNILTVVGSTTVNDLSISNALGVSLTGTPTIDLAIGDNDTGLEQEADGILSIRANGNNFIRIDPIGGTPHEIHLGGSSSTNVLIGTTTSGTKLNVGGTVTAEGFSGNGAGLTGLSVAFSAVAGSITSTQLPVIINLQATTTTPTSIDNYQIHNRKYTSVGDDLIGSNNKLLLRFADGTSTITNSGSASHTFTTTNVIGTSTSLFAAGTSSASLSAGYFDTEAHADFNLGTGTGAFVWDVDFAIGTTTTAVILGYVTYRVLDIITDGSTLQLYLSSNNTTWDLGAGDTEGEDKYTGTLTSNTRYHLEFSWDAVNKYRVFLDGAKIMETTSATTLYSVNGSLRHGARRDAALALTGRMENIRFNRTTGAVSNFTRPTFYYGVSVSNANIFSIIPPNTITPIFKIDSPGTSGASPSYIFNNATTTVFGGYGTSSISTVTVYVAYGVPNKGGAAFDSLNVHSVDEVKTNIQDLTGKEHKHLQKLMAMQSKSWNPPDLNICILDAEEKAKKQYIGSYTAFWSGKNKENYIISTHITGTGTGKVYDEIALLKNGKLEAELAWASDLNQNKYINDARANTSIEYMGFRVDDPTTPNEVKGADGRTIDVMKVLTMSVESIKALESRIKALENK